MEPEKKSLRNDATPALIVITRKNLFIWRSRMLLHIIINMFFHQNEFCKVKNLISSSALKEINKKRMWFLGEGGEEVRTFFKQSWAT